MQDDSDPITVWLIEDNEAYRRRVRTAVNRGAGMNCTGEYGSIETAMADLNESTSPKIVLLDVGLPGVDGITGISQIKGVSSETKVVILTVFDDRDRVFRAVCAGADGYLLKNSTATHIGESIREVVAGGASLTPQIARNVLDQFLGNRKHASEDRCDLTEREVEVLQMIVEGLTKQEIASRLFLSTHTVDSHLRHIYQKLHVNNRAAAVAAALRQGLI